MANYKIHKRLSNTGGKSLADNTLYLNEDVGRVCMYVLEFPLLSPQLPGLLTGSRMLLGSFFVNSTPIHTGAQLALPCLLR